MRLAVIAHDGKKPEMVAFLLKNIKKLENSEIVATGTTGSHAEKAGLKVKRYLSGPMGGDAQIAALLVENQLDLIIFFRDPQGKHPHEPDIQMLMRLCDVHNVPLATNPAGGQLLLDGLLVSN